MAETINKSDVSTWMEKLKSGWVNKQKEEVIKLFQETRKYYERPYNPGTTIEEIREYWNDIDGLEKISLDYNVVAIDGNTAFVHWDNKYSFQGKNYHLDGIFLIKFNNDKECIEFRQWWMKSR